MKFFGDYLIEKGLVTEERLVEALLDQVKALPTVAEIVVEKSWLDKGSILKVFGLQSSRNLEFRQACKELGLWKDQYDFEIKKEITRQRTPLGHLLCKAGVLSAEILSKNLEEFIALQSTGKAPESPAPVVELPKIEVAPTIPEEVLNPEFQKVDESIAADYFELLNDDKRAELEKDVLVWETLGRDPSGQNLQDIDASFQRVYRDYHTIKGSARFIRADLSEKIIHRAEDLISFCKRFSQYLAPADFEKLTSLNLKVFDLVWDLRDRLRGEGSEESFWTNEAQRSHFLEVLKALKIFNDDLESRNYEISLDQVKDAF